MQNECSCSRTLGSVDSPSRRSDDSSLGLSLFSDKWYCPISNGPIHRSSFIRNVCSTNRQSHSTRPLAVGMRIISTVPWIPAPFQAAVFPGPCWCWVPPALLSIISPRETFRAFRINSSANHQRYQRDASRKAHCISHAILSDRASGH